MGVDQAIREARERLHRSIGQRARWAKAAIADRLHYERGMMALRWMAFDGASRYPTKAMRDEAWRQLLNE